jgi:hypothetical protein
VSKQSHPIQVISKHRQLIFYSLWISFALAQSYFTELMDDEAYYWLYSRFIDYGYFEHPPLIALLIKAGYFIFKNELGVRLLTVVLNTATIYLIQQLLTRKNDVLFYAIILTIAITQLGGFIAVPDGPLLFFTALFFISYQLFIKHVNLANALLLGLSAGMLLYSKYHGILVILFTLMSNPGLFKKHLTWFAASITLIMLIPHMYWQWVNDFPTIQFHFFERTRSSHSIGGIFSFVFAQILIAGPLFGWLLIWSAMMYTPASLNEKALKYTMTGIYIFFFICSFIFRVEANWTIPAMIGVIVLSHQYLNDKVHLRKWIYISVPATLLFVFVNRFILMYDHPITNKYTRQEFHNNQRSAELLEKQIGSLPLVIINSYQKSSKYWFYTSHTAFSLNTASYHRNSFNYWPVEDSLIGHTVAVIGNKDPLLNKSLDMEEYPEAFWATVNNYYSFSKIRFNKVENILLSDNVIRFSCIVKTPPAYLYFLKQNLYPAEVYLALYNKDDILTGYSRCNVDLRAITQPVNEYNVSCPVSNPRSIFAFSIAVSTSMPGIYSINSYRFSIVRNF